MRSKKELRLKYYADVKIVSGASQSAIYDLSRHNLILFPSSLLDFVRSLEGKDENQIRSICSHFGSAEAGQFLDFILGNELAAFVGEEERFPPLVECFETPALVDNAIIDVGSVWHDFRGVVAQLDKLGCQFLQIRLFSDVSRDRVVDIVEICASSAIRGLELVCRYAGDDDYRYYTGVMQKYPNLTVVIHSVPVEVAERNADDGLGREDGYDIRPRLVSEHIESSSSCGKIRLGSLNVPSVAVYKELRSCNGCLNQKVSVDVHGQIKNCPSLNKSYGLVDTTPIKDVLEKPEFNSVWKIKKDDIEICRDCQFRYVCTDCRAFLVDPANIFSKPLKCGYDPYTNVWND